MSEIARSDERREFLAMFLSMGADYDDPVRPRLVEAVAACVATGELSLGVAIVALMSARGVGLHERAACLLWELASGSIRASSGTPAAAHTP